MDVVFEINLAVEEALVITITHGFTSDAHQDITLGHDHFSWKHDHAYDSPFVPRSNG